MTLDLSATICALATPPGVGGIAVVRLSGPEAYPIAEKVFRPADPRRRLADARGYTALFGHSLRPDGAVLDETVALCFRAPRSYTGEDVVELSCHGGGAMAEGLVQACLAAGAKPAGAGEFTRRAFEHGRISLTQAEAVMDAIQAAGRQGAALAAAALDGALARRIGAIRDQLTALAAHLAAWVDFPEEDVPALEPAALAATLTDCRDKMQVLIDQWGAGAVALGGVDTAIVGRPNVGKSTLLNLLAGFERAIVTPVAGTTRDVVQQTVQLGGVRLNLSDTAGLRDTADLVEAEGIRRSYRALDAAGLVLAVFDASEPATEEDARLAGLCRGRPALALVNKQDAGEQVFDESVLAGCFSEVLHLSAKDPASLELLAGRVETLLGVANLDPSAGCLSGQRQLAAATAACNALKDALDAQRRGFGLDAVGVCVDEALQALYELTGEGADEAVIDQVFSRFCVGK